MEESEMRIAVLDRGWVYAGKCRMDGDTLVISQAKNIRRWGTAGGLGELAAKGPLADTKMDDYGTVRVPQRAVIFLVECDPAAWADKQAA